MIFWVEKKRMREGFLRNPESLPRASCATQNEEVAEQLSFLYLSTFPFNKLMPCAYIQKTSPIGLVLHFWLAEREGLRPIFAMFLAPFICPSYHQE